MRKRKYTVEFLTDDDWAPYEPACWFHCPIAELIKFNEHCRCLDAYKKEGLDLCPLTSKFKEVENTEVQ